MPKAITNPTPGAAEPQSELSRPTRRAVLAAVAGGTALAADPAAAAAMQAFGADQDPHVAWCAEWRALVAYFNPHFPDESSFWWQCGPILLEISER